MKAIRKTANRRTTRRSNKRGSNRRYLGHALETLEGRQLLTAGLLDPGFGDGGLVQTDLVADSRDQGRDVAIQADGKIVAAGVVGSGLGEDVAIVRYNPDGSLDPSFDDDGKLVVPIAGQARIHGVVIQQDGKIVVGGSRNDQYGGWMLAMRFNPDGSSDPSFGTDGLVAIRDIHGLSTHSSHKQAEAFAVALDAQENIILAGKANVPDSTYPAFNTDVAVARLTPSGDLDTSFSGDGKAYVNLGGSTDTAYSVSIDSVGRVVLAARESNGGIGSVDSGSIVRFNADGSLDTGFASNGVWNTGGSGYFTSVDIDANDHVVASGNVNNLAAIARLDPSGTLDPSFGDAGYSVINGNFRFDDVMHDDLGRVMAFSNNQALGAWRFLGDGARDLDYGTGGASFASFGFNSSGGKAALQQDGSFVALGSVQTAAGVQLSDFALARFLGDNASPVIVSNNTFSISENATDVATLVASDPDVGQTVSFSISGGADASFFSIAPTGELVFNQAPDFETPADADSDNVYEVEVLADDANGGTDTELIQVTVLNQASISGSVFVDVNTNDLFDANEIGIDGVTVRLLDTSGNPVIDANNQAIQAITADGGFYLFEDLDPAEYQLAEVQPSGVTDGVEILGSLGGSIVADDVMKLTLARDDASDYYFAEVGGDVSSGDSATIGFWQNKHGQALIESGGTALAGWLTSNFGNVFGNTFSDGLGGDDGSEVARFFKDELFKQKAKKSTGPAKVDAQFMATALATFFTSSNLAGSIATSYGFNVTDTGIGTGVINVGSSGAAFGVADNTELSILQLLQATNSMTDQPDLVTGAAKIYDIDGDGVISAEEAELRAKANLIYSLINEFGGI